MRRIDTNHFQHLNGVYYARYKRAGKGHWVSLRTRSVKEARVALRNVLRPLPVDQAPAGPPVDALGAADRQMIAEVISQVMRAEFTPLLSALRAPGTSGETPSLSSETSLGAPAPLPRPDFQRAVRQYLDSRTFKTKDTGDMYRTEMNRLLKFARDWEGHLAGTLPGKLGMAPPACDWETFSPVALWKAVRMKQEPGRGHSTLNQFANYLRHLCRWWNDRGWITGLCLKEAESLSRMEVMPRDIQICTPEKMTTLLAQIQQDDKVSGWFPSGICS